MGMQERYIITTENSYLIDLVKQILNGYQKL